MDVSYTVKLSKDWARFFYLQRPQGYSGCNIYLIEFHNQLHTSKAARTGSVII